MHFSFVRLAALVGAAFAVVAGVALATDRKPGSSADRSLTACVRPNGHVRVVVEPSACRRDEKALLWNLGGPKGDPGPAGPPGVAGPPDPPGRRDQWRRRTGGTGRFRRTCRPDRSDRSNWRSGAAGAVGPAGPSGPGGPAGPAGATGSAGQAGPQGAAGDRGPQDRAGAQGPEGRSRRLTHVVRPARRPLRAPSGPRRGRSRSISTPPAAQP